MYPLAEPGRIIKRWRQNYNLFMTNYFLITNFVQPSSTAKYSFPCTFISFAPEIGVAASNGYVPGESETDAEVMTVATRFVLSKVYTP